MGKKIISECPKAFIDGKTNAVEQLKVMLDRDPMLYEKCISTVGFAYGFSQLVNRAIHFDWLQKNGIIPSDYPKNEAENE